MGAISIVALIPLFFGFRRYVSKYVPFSCICPPTTSLTETFRLPAVLPTSTPSIRNSERSSSSTTLPFSRMWGWRRRRKAPTESLLLPPSPLFSLLFPPLSLEVLPTLSYERYVVRTFSASQETRKPLSFKRSTFTLPPPLYSYEKETPRNFLTLSSVPVLRTDCWPLIWELWSLKCCSPKFATLAAGEVRPTQQHEGQMTDPQTTTRPPP